ncbi:hypothetical protein, partial [Geobacillus stearothermophilus]|uniref:hypothetical protein n=1 Tax=Geobacillus stearothermophilus TaxID=1422 RepID=UPI002E23163C|nr:hypothetical protein [Geobacillus stearothermophilus]
YSTRKKGDSSIFEAKKWGLIPKRIRVLGQPLSYYLQQRSFGIEKFLYRTHICFYTKKPLIILPFPFV